MPYPSAAVGPKPKFDNHGAATLEVDNFHVELRLVKKKNETNERKKKTKC